MKKVDFTCLYDLAEALHEAYPEDPRVKRLVTFCDDVDAKMGDVLQASDRQLQYATPDGYEAANEFEVQLHELGKMFWG